MPQYARAVCIDSPAVRIGWIKCCFMILSEFALQGFSVCMGETGFTCGFPYSSAIFFPASTFWGLVDRGGKACLEIIQITKTTISHHVDMPSLIGFNRKCHIVTHPNNKHILITN